MIGRLITFDKRTYQTPPLTEWEIVRTGSVPCDSFCIRCAAAPEMMAVLPNVTRFLAMENGGIELYGVVDDYCVECSENGLTLEVNGRGLAALLLDSETEAVSYESATLQEIVRDHVLPFGVACTVNEGGGKRFSYSASSGSSHWKVVQGCAELCGVEPHFSKEGKLELKAARGTARVLDESTPLCAALYREKRYGVISEITLIDRKSNTRETVRNEEFIARGGLSRRVLYTSGSGARSEGERQIEASREESRLLMVTMADATAFDIGDRVDVRLSSLGVTGTFRVSEIARRASSGGEITEVTMQGV